MASRTYSKPPWPSNMIAVTHGAYCERIRDPLVRELVERVLADEANAYLRQAAYQVPLRHWAEATVMADQLLAHLAKHRADGCMFCKKCAVWDEQARRWRAAAARDAPELLLTPRSRAKAGQAITPKVDIAMLMSEAAEQDGEP